jgi:hypothetical protein
LLVEPVGGEGQPDNTSGQDQSTIHVSAAVRALLRSRQRAVGLR